MSRSNLVRSQKLCAIARENDQKWANWRILMTSQLSFNRGYMSHWNRLRSKKLCAITHENGQKWPNRRVLMTSQFSCSRGHEPFKSCQEPKTVCNSPRKRPEMTKLMSFDDVPIFLYPGSWAVEIVPGDKKPCPIATKKPRNETIDDFWRRPNFHVPAIMGKNTFTSCIHI